MAPRRAVSEWMRAIIEKMGILRVLGKNLLQSNPPGGRKYVVQGLQDV
jgi:hypothetical protein